jgi:hypothetical protein
VKQFPQIFLVLALFLPISLPTQQTTSCVRNVPSFVAMSGRIESPSQSLTPVSTALVNELAQCDGLPHPENGQPAPCGSPNQSLPNPNSGADWRLAQQQRQQQQQQQQRERERQERARIHRCELQAQQDHDDCKQRNPNGYCPLKQCY